MKIRHNFGRNNFDKNINPYIPNHYRIDLNKEKVGYCYIRKNACSTFKQLIIENSEVSIDKQKNMYEPDRMMFIHANHRIKYDEIRNYKKILLVLRDPLNRIVSGFLNQFIMRLNRENEKLHCGVEENTFISAGDLTFFDFVEKYLGANQWDKIDVHFHPQVSKIEPIFYSHVLLFEKLFSDICYTLGEEVAHKYFKEPKNSVVNFENMIIDNAGQIPSSKIYSSFCKTGALPRKESFLKDEKIVNKLKNIYWRDIELYYQILQLRKGKNSPVSIDFS